VIAVDTNVLVRLPVDDSQAPAQVSAARKLLKDKGPAFVSQIVQVETVWVLF
jgi:predicted nucleic-acid-binding protein